jgi:siroheme synthase (precorrin-2 oxidase/ferrochelatase)
MSLLHLLPLPSHLPLPRKSVCVGGGGVCARARARALCRRGKQSTESLKQSFPPNIKLVLLLVSSSRKPEASILRLGKLNS